MKITQFLTRLVLMVFVCGLVVFANISPANAAWGRASNPTKGTEPLPNITDLTEKAANSSPYEINDNPSGLNSSKVNKGLNEVQGTADINRMKRDNYGDKLPVVREAEKAVDKADNKLKSAKTDTENNLRSVKTDTENNLRSVKTDAENSANSVLDQASDLVSDVKDKAGDAFNSLTGKAEDTAKSIKQKVKS
jgi:ElaB/YqjD/DUF883 family membrane-anchored ribosome-binding protein